MGGWAFGVRFLARPFLAFQSLFGAPFTWPRVAAWEVADRAIKTRRRNLTSSLLCQLRRIAHIWSWQAHESRRRIRKLWDEGTHLVRSGSDGIHLPLRALNERDRVGKHKGIRHLVHLRLVQSWSEMATREGSVGRYGNASHHRRVELIQIHWCVVVTRAQAQWDRSLLRQIAD